MKTKLVAAVLVAIAGLSVSAAESTRPNVLSFLVGSWSGKGSGEPGQGMGSFTFARELDGRILVRRAHSEYPARDGKPAVIHDDLLIVHSGGTAADYFDNEGHVIHYEVTTDPQEKTATFLSVDQAPSPLFRLTYRQVAPGEVEISFDIAPKRGEPFKTYVKGTSVRTSTK